MVERLISCCWLVYNKAFGELRYCSRQNGSARKTLHSFLILCSIGRSSETSHILWQRSFTTQSTAWKHMVEDYIKLSNFITMSYDIKMSSFPTNQSILSSSKKSYIYFFFYLLLSSVENKRIHFEKKYNSIIAQLYIYSCIHKYPVLSGCQRSSNKIVFCVAQMKEVKSCRFRMSKSWQNLTIQSFPKR